MTHSRMLDHVPSVCITHDRNELKVYQGNIVYLNDGDNFELRFFNPTNLKIGVEIMFNGIKKGDSYLVLNPGQDIILDRFLNEQRKMLFETYVINGESAEAVKAIEQNGVITFNFYKEYYRSNYNQPIVNVNYNFPPKPAKPIKYKKMKGMKGGSFVNNYSSGIYNYSSGISGSSGSSGISGISGTSLTINTTGNVGIGITSPTNSINFDKDYWIPNSASVTLESLLDYIPLETGRIEMGDISNQHLKTVNAQFATIAFHSITYKLMPYSAMNRTISEVRMYCSSCGYRLRKEAWEFCPKCGFKIL